ncbi:MAG: DUF4129 domain-containing transglutaminase family protein [Pseudomonadota bacterium]
MKLRYIQFVAIMLWGYQTDLLLFALPMAIMLETRFHLNRRWDLARQDFYRMADLTGVALVGIVVFLFLNRTEYHFITTLVAWLPIIFFPLVVVLVYSTTERMPLDVLFYSLRRQQAPVTQSWDMSYVFFGMCLVGGGLDKAGETYYLPLAAALVLAALFPLRSPRYSARLWLLAALTIFLSGAVTHQALRAGHLALKEQSRVWLANYIKTRTNPLKTRTSIGSIGRLKTSDEILFRVADLTGAGVPGLLQEATYSVPTEYDWLVINPQFATVPPTDDFLWRLQDDAPGSHRLKIYLEFEREVGIVPVPASVTEIFDLPALELRRSLYGSIQATGLVPSPGYEVGFYPGVNINGPPDREDTYVPTEYVELLREVTPVDADPIRAVRRLFDSFAYSLYTPGVADPLKHFLLESRAGHCEYFATATVLMLRQMGIPARYAVGFSVQEYHPGLDMFVVRARHAHAWAIAWVDNRWQVVDTTPGTWASLEAEQSGLFRPLIDLLSNSTFKLQRWWAGQRLADYETELYVLGGLLLIVLVWRIARSEQVIINRRDDTAVSAPPYPGMDSPFFEIESKLLEEGLVRAPGETLGHYLQRIGQQDLLPLLEFHYRLRFDPAGLPDADTTRLRERARAWIEHARDFRKSSP